MAIGEANGKSSTFTIKITIGYPDRLCGPPVVRPLSRSFPPVRVHSRKTRRHRGKVRCHKSAAGCTSDVIGSI